MINTLIKNETEQTRNAILTLSEFCSVKCKCGKVKLTAPNGNRYILRLNNDKLVIDFKPVDNVRVSYIEEKIIIRLFNLVRSNSNKKMKLRGEKMSDKGVELYPVPKTMRGFKERVSCIGFITEDMCVVISKRGILNVFKK